MEQYGLASVQRLQDLHQDLLNLSEARLSNIERLWQELESHIEDFRHLLDKPAKSDKSRQLLTSGTSNILRLGDEDYEVNAQFKEDAIRVADALELDEIEAAKLYLTAQEDAVVLDRSPLATSIITFHQRRQFLLECIQLSFTQAIEADGDEDVSGPFRQLVSLVLTQVEGQLGSGSKYWRRCVDTMLDLERWQTKITERVQSVSLTGQAQSVEFAEVMDFQHTSLTRQHELLATMASLLIKGNHTSPDDLSYLLSKARTFDRYDLNLVHHFLIISTSILHFASADGFCSPEEARALNDSITSKKDQDTWVLHIFQAVTIIIWLSEYSGRLADRGSSEANQEELLQKNSNMILESLKDGGFHFLLAVCQSLRSSDWYDPAKEGFTAFLIQDGSPLHFDSFTASLSFQRMFLEQIQGFTESFITNVPDTLRKLKFDEDEQRRTLQSRVQLRASEYELHFERFLILISYGFYGFPEAAEAFWSDPESNLHGFLQWASQRQSTPRTAAFCEMLCALSDGPECSTQAHSFLMHEFQTSATRNRRSSPLGWGHILREIEFYTSSVKDRPTLQSGLTAQGIGRQQSDNLLEPESMMMLECYLRLIAQLAKNSSVCRAWLLSSEPFKFSQQQSTTVQQLFLLCSSSIESRLRACAFTALSAILQDKNSETNDGLWTVLDSWIFGGSSMNPATSKAQGVQNLTEVDEAVIFESIATGFEEPNAFVKFLHTLVVPIPSEDELTTTSGQLPFPESLGAAYRMPGMETYVDFILGRVFATKSRDLHDPVQLRILRWNCLQFVTVCLSDFDENLVVFANRSSIPIDKVIHTSNLAAYVRLHPFGRVMEWMFNDKVIGALFASIMQDVREISEAEETSPLVLSVIASIETISLILDRQSTYFDLVRPAIKMGSTVRRLVVSNSALASFEDAVLTNLDLPSVLGFYIGTGHRDLSLASLKLLHQLSVSRKLAVPSLAGPGRRLETSRLITALEKDNAAEDISRTLIVSLQLNERELENWSESSGFAIKKKILNFLTACIDAVPGRPTVAHLLLGFSCAPTSLSVQDDSLFANSSSLFHSILRLAVGCPIGEENSIVSGLVELKHDAMQVLHRLWASPISSTATLSELQASDAFFIQAVQVEILQPDTLFDGRSIGEPDFYMSTSADACLTFLRSRATFYELAATELARVHTEKLQSLLERMQSTLLGFTRLPDDQQVENPTIFEYLDFLQVGAGPVLDMPETAFFNPRDFDVCRNEDPGMTPTFDIEQAEQLVRLKINEIQEQQPTIKDEKRKDEWAQILADAENIITCLKANNTRAQILEARTSTLRSWINVVTSSLNSFVLEPVQCNSFCLQTLLIVLPRLEGSFSDDWASAIPLAELCRSVLTLLVATSKKESLSIPKNTTGETLLELFRLGVQGIQNPQATAELRMVLCQICHSYLLFTRVAASMSQSRHNALQWVKSRGDAFVEVVCDDSYAGTDQCRVSSLLLLEALISTSQQADSTFIIESLNRLNFSQVLVDSIKSMPSEVQDAANTGSVSSLLSYLDANLLLLLSLARSRAGASLLLSSGLFSSLRESGLFSADPDIGLELDNPEALSKYFDLMLSCMRIINAVLLSKGPENDQVLREARQFLHEYRPSLVSILKRNAGIGSLGRNNAAVVGELVDNITILISMSGFLESEEENLGQSKQPTLFL